MAGICVLGLGYVGVVTASCFSVLDHNVTGVDKDSTRVELLSTGTPPFFEPGLEELLRAGLDKGLLSFTGDIDSAILASDIIFICVGTPSGATGRADLNQVEAVSRSIAGNLNDYKLIVEKSTVPVGTAERIKQTILLTRGNNCPSFDVACNPEFLKEGSAVNDFLYPDRIVLGAESSRARQILRDLYKDFDCPLLFTDTATAELIKHASNAFLATKISFINFVADICERVGANVTMVASGMGYDKRIGRRFLDAGAGYGGSCFPKDIKALAATADALGIDAGLLREVDRINEKRICSLLEKLEDALWVCSRKKIAVLGLAFKHNTDDVRNSPGVKLVQKLVRMDCRVACHDPVAMDNARQQLNIPGDIVSFAASPYDAVQGADALMIMTDWPEFARLDYPRVRQLMQTPVIIDGRNILPAAEMEALGFRYYGTGLCRPRT